MDVYVNRRYISNVAGFDLITTKVGDRRWSWTIRRDGEYLHGTAPTKREATQNALRAIDRAQTFANGQIVAGWGKSVNDEEVY